MLQRTKSKWKRHAQKGIVDIFIYSILICIVFLILYPLIRNISDMFKSQGDLLNKSVAFIPKEFSLDRIRQALEYMDFWNSARDTALLSLSMSLLQTLVCTMTGYGFARFKFPFTRLCFALVIFTMLVPSQLLMPSYYMQFRVFGSNSPLPLLILSFFGLGFKDGLFIYFIQQCFINMPKELDESARIDGAGFLRIFFRIMLPNARPVIVTVLLLSFSWQWTEEYFTSLFMPGHMFLSSAFIPLANAQNLDGVVVAANVTTGVILTILPVFVLYLFLQKFFVQGVERSGLVG